MRKFTILHLSDSHIGKSKQRLDSLEVFETLFEDIRERVSTVGVPDLIVFSGDLVFGREPGKPFEEQFTKAEEFLKRVHQSVKSDWDRSPILLVPGNHDVDRSAVGSDQTEWFESLKQKSETADEDVYAEVLNDTVLYRRVLERQKVWTEFVDRLYSGSSNLGRVNGFTYCDLRHETSKYGPIKISTIGFNSAWAAADDADANRLWVGRHQMQSAIERTRASDFSIAVTHHPVGWLHTQDKKFFSERVQTRFRMHFHGHEHNAWFQDQGAHCLLAAGACYEGSKKRNGYSWVSIDFDAREALLELRDYSDQGKGGWIARQVPGKTDANGRATLKNFMEGWRNDDAATSAVRVSPSMQKPILVPSRASKASISAIRSYGELIQFLENSFEFRWEPASFNSSEPSPLVYWPVRLRRPTPIHAAQSFSAAALQKFGAEVHLFIDDLGTLDFSSEEFERSLKKRFSRVGGDEKKLRVTRFSDVLQTSGAATDREVDPWPSIRKWLGETPHMLVDILRISKLIPMQGDAPSVDALGKRRPRRLLTPALVWSCLVYLHDKFPGRSIVTLGGRDEAALWRAWRDSSATSTAHVGHLYAPQLAETDGQHGTRALHMEKTGIEWESMDDIKSAIRAELKKGGASGRDWSEPGRLLPWGMASCVFLPQFVSGEEMSIKLSDGEILPDTALSGIESNALIDGLSAAMSPWLI